MTALSDALTKGESTHNLAGMRSIVALCLALVTACVSNQELAPTSTLSPGSTEPSPATTTTVDPGPASTFEADDSTTTTTTVTTTTLDPLQGLAYEKVADLSFPIQMTALPGSEIAYVATKDGRIWTYDGTGISATPILDISGQVRNRGEQGLLSISLHPNDESRFFAHYSASDGDTVVSEFAFVTRDEIDPDSEEVLLRLDQPARNHNGGMISIDPARNLYVGLGDGGGANDQFGNGQNTGTLLGGLVKIVLDTDQEPMLWQFGLRNPWRFWFDSDLIYVADVGQNSYEEISVAPNGRDVNYGWPITEGLHCFRPATGCDTDGLTLPVIEVSHGDAGTCSITGGIVYRGAMIPEVDGHFFYSDFCGGYLRSFRFDGSAAVDRTDWTSQVGVPGSVVGFGVDGAGEMYVATTGELLRVVPERG